jgi:hypothetical protein
MKNLFLLLVFLASTTSAAPTFTPEQLGQDLQFLRQSIASIHPDPGYSVQGDRLEHAYRSLQAELSKPLSYEQAWRAFSRLNPVFADGHLGILDPDWRAHARSHLDAGGLLVPFELQIGADGELHVRSELGGGPSPYQRQRIVSINGMAGRQVGQAILDTTMGETPALRAHLASRRAWLAYWMLFGAPPRYQVVLESGMRLDLAGSPATPVALRPDTLDSTFQCELLAPKAALLTINQFVWDDKRAYLGFMERCFARIEQAGIEKLIIDVRANTGGNDDLWKEGVLPYIATKPFRNGAGYVKKVIAGRVGAGETLGAVVTGEVTSWVAPQPAQAHRFGGKVYVLVGGLTYSSAVLFSNVVQDFEFGKLVGAGGYARARQSGGIQQVNILPHTKLEIVVPRFVLDRPSGVRDASLVRPDIILPDDPFNPRALVDAVLKL